MNYRRHLASIGRLCALVIYWKMLYAAFIHFFYAVPIDDSLSNLVNYTFFFQGIPDVSTGHFWCFQALVTLYFILSLLRLRRKKKLLLYLMLLLLVFSCVTFDLDLFFRLLQKLSGKHVPDMMLLATLSPFHPTYAVYILYPLLGRCLYAERGKCIRYRRFASVCIVLGLIGPLLIKYLQNGLWSWQGVHIVSGYYYASTMLIAAGLMLLFVNKTAVSAPEQWIGRVIEQHTLGIFFLHSLPYTVPNCTLYPYIRAWNSWYLNLPENLGIVVLSALYAILFRKGIRAFTAFLQRKFWGSAAVTVRRQVLCLTSASISFYRFSTALSSFKFLTMPLRFRSSRSPLSFLSALYLRRTRLTLSMIRNKAPAVSFDPAGAHVSLICFYVPAFATRRLNNFLYSP